MYPSGQTRKQDINPTCLSQQHSLQDAQTNRDATNWFGDIPLICGKERSSPYLMPEETLWGQISSLSQLHKPEPRLGGEHSHIQVSSVEEEEGRREKTKPSSLEVSL